MLYFDSSHQIKQQARRAEETAPCPVDEQGNHQNDHGKHDTVEREATHTEHTERFEEDQIANHTQGKQDQDDE